ncbi:hypothetical protein FHS31_000409 [Sphingomonas vulcanisoli]|uniref:Lipoprotein n=1 Tax=Sphingomonas vulcanisoli TaxID=1658060 RepID=A0ABX0TMT9_9SPHN|nr:hypothetical protein [Sphingomonas vulcanisoli]NIJ06827.1 hypothetical protein [Sphingomonas vulcanisoli]
MLPALLLVAGCVAQSREKPFLTPKAFVRASANCHVVSKGVHHSLGSEVPYAQYLIPTATGEARSDEGQSRLCLQRALSHYRYDFLGEEIPKAQQ